jgi:hypothetical protein
VLPDEGEQLKVGLGSTESEALALYVTTAPALLVASAVTFPGVEIDGAVVSTTVTVRTLCGPCVSPVAVSVAVQFTSVAPIGKTSPELWSHEIDTGFGGTSLSVAVIENVATAPLADVASIVWLETGSKTGGSAPARETPKTSTPTRAIAKPAQTARSRPLPRPDIRPQ